jgi:hypothetical protein
MQFLTLIDMGSYGSHRNKGLTYPAQLKLHARYLLFFCLNQPLHCPFEIGFAAALHNLSLNVTEEGKAKPDKALSDRGQHVAEFHRQLHVIDAGDVENPLQYLAAVLWSDGLNAEYPTQDVETGYAILPGIFLQIFVENFVQDVLETVAKFFKKELLEGG